MYKECGGGAVFSLIKQERQKQPCHSVVPAASGGYRVENRQMSPLAVTAVVTAFSPNPAVFSAVSPGSAIHSEDYEWLYFLPWCVQDSQSLQDNHRTATGGYWWGCFV